VSIVGYGLALGGAILFAVGYARARDPWRRYQALKAQDENAARYRAWRGGPAESEETGASVAMRLLRRQARSWATVGLVGVA